MDQNTVDLIIAAAGIVADGIITGIIGTVLLNKSKKELQQMQHDHEDKMQQRQQEFEKSLRKQQEEKEEKDSVEIERKNAIEKYHNGVSAFLADSWNDDAFAQASGSYMSVLKYAPPALHKKITDLNNLILTIHNTDNPIGEHGTIDERRPLEIKAANLFTEISREWNELQSTSVPKPDKCGNSKKDRRDHNDPVEQCPLPEEKPSEFIF